MIYGPSYMSFEYALHYHGVIPERVETLTSATLGRARRFYTPVGLFSYQTVPQSAYAVGIARVELKDGRGFLIARPEKALADKVYADRGMPIRNRADMRDYLFRHLRANPSSISGLDAGVAALMVAGYRSRKIRLLAALLRKER